MSIDQPPEARLEWYQHGLALLVCHAFFLFSANYVLMQMPWLSVLFVLAAEGFFVWAIVATVRYRHIDPWYRFAIPLILGIALGLGNVVGLVMLFITWLK